MTALTLFPARNFLKVHQSDTVSVFVSMVTAGERVTHLQGRRFQEQHAKGVRDRGAEREDPGEAQQRCRGMIIQTGAVALLM